MREAPVAEEDRTADVTPAAPWRVVSVSVPEYPVLSVRFVDGVEGRVTIQPSFMEGVFTPLRDPEFFAKAFVERGAVSWPGELDLAPDAMHDAIETAGECVVG